MKRYAIIAMLALVPVLAFLNMLAFMGHLDNPAIKLIVEWSVWLLVITSMILNFFNWGPSIKLAWPVKSMIFTVAAIFIPLAGFSFMGSFPSVLEIMRLGEGGLFNHLSACFGALLIPLWFLQSKTDSKTLDFYV